MDVSAEAEILPRGGQKLLRRPLVKGLAQFLQLGLAEFIGRVEALGLEDGVGLGQPVQDLRPDELHQSLVGGVAADHPALCVEHGLGVLADGQVQQALDLAVLRQLRQGDGDAVGGEELHHLQVPLGDGARLVAEQDVQRAGGLDALRLAHQHVVVQHLAGVLHQHQGDHQGQALGDGADDDHDGQGHRLHHIFDDLRRAQGEVRPEAPSGQDEIAQIHHRDHDGADVAEPGDHIGQL